MRRKSVFAACLCSAILCAPAQAAFERDCVVAVQSRSGWSKAQTSTVYFMTGLELARITRVLRVEFRQIYAVIMQESGLPTVARLDGLVPGVGREFTADDFARLFERDAEHLATQLEGEGRNLKWRLRGSLH